MKFFTNFSCTVWTNLISICARREKGVLLKVWFGLRAVRNASNFSEMDKLVAVVDRYCSCLGGRSGDGGGDLLFYAEVHTSGLRAGSAGAILA